MDRRLFLLSTAATLIGRPTDPELVVDYESKNPDLYRTVAYDGKEVAHMPPAGISDKTLPNFTYYDVKKAWVLPDGRLKMERYKIAWTSDGSKHKIVNLERDVAGEPKTHVTILTDWRLVTVDANGHTIRERRPA